MKLIPVLLAIISTTVGQLPIGQELPLVELKPGLFHSVIIKPELPIIKGFVPPVEAAEPAEITVSSPAIPAVSSPVYEGDIKTQYYIRDLLGQASYGHIEPGQRHHAFQDVHGNKIGGFSYYDAEGKLVQTGYIADQDGYRVVSNNLPIAVADTPEVSAAKLKHLLELEKAKQFQIVL